MATSKPLDHKATEPRMALRLVSDEVRLSLVSDLSQSLPVTEAEVELVYQLVGMRIDEIFMRRK